MKKIILAFILAEIIVFLASCNVSKDIATPPAAIPEKYRTIEAAPDSTNIADIKWQDFFSNAGLQKLIENTLTNNYDMQTALKNIESAQLIVKLSRLGYLPEARLQATGAINRPSDNSLNGLSIGQFLGKSYVEDYNISAVLSWEADIWKKVKNQKSKALATYLQTAEARKLIQTNLVSVIAKGYYNLLMLDAQVAIAKKNLLLNDSTLNIIKLQYTAGQVTDLAVQQATAQQLVAAQLIPQLELEISLQENALSVLAAVKPDAIVRNGSINEPIFKTDLVSGLPAQLLANRPDVKSRELDLVIANANTGIAKANMYPALNITAAGGLNSFVASNWFNIPASLFATAAGSLTQPLFLRKQLKTQYKVSTIEREKTVIGFRQTVLQAVGEVSNALVSVNKFKEQQEIAVTRVGTLEKSIKNADLLFRNGMANYLEVITAQSNVLQGELELASIQKEQVNAVVELYRSLGGGWK